MSESVSARRSHLAVLEAESIHILRETAAEFAHPMVLYSIGMEQQVEHVLGARETTP